MMVDGYVNQPVQPLSMPLWIHGHCLRRYKPSSRVQVYPSPSPSLVGGFNSSEKYQSIGVIIPNIWKIKNEPNHQPDQVRLDSAGVSLFKGKTRRFAARPGLRSKRSKGRLVGLRDLASGKVHGLMKLYNSWGPQVRYVCWFINTRNCVQLFFAYHKSLRNWSYQETQLQDMKPETATFFMGVRKLTLQQAYPYVSHGAGIFSYKTG